MNADFPSVIEAMTSVAVVWANLAYLFVTVPMLVARLNGRWDSHDEAGLGFSLGRWGLPVNLAAVAFGLVVVTNTGWPRAAIYGDGLLGRTGALVPTLAMIGAGVAYDRLHRRRRGAGIVSEHRGWNPPGGWNLPRTTPRPGETRPSGRALRAGATPGRGTPPFPDETRPVRRGRLVLARAGRGLRLAFPRKRRDPR
ncbi:MAG: hypothetical protein U0835_07520 [Isosphaeraceae bacterium]